MKGCEPKQTVLAWLNDLTNALFCSQGDSGDGTDDEMISRKTRSCKETLGRRESDPLESVEHEDAGESY